MDTAANILLLCSAFNSIGFSLDDASYSIINNIFVHNHIEIKKLENTYFYKTNGVLIEFNAFVKYVNGQPFPGASNLKSIFHYIEMLINIHNGDFGTSKLVNKNYQEEYDKYISVAGSGMQDLSIRYLFEKIKFLEDKIKSLENNKC